MKKTIISGFVAAALILLDSCAKNPVTGKNDLMLMSEQQEIARVSSPTRRSFLSSVFTMTERCKRSPTDWLLTPDCRPPSTAHHRPF